MRQSNVERQNLRADTAESKAENAINFDGLWNLLRAAGCCSAGTSSTHFSFWRRRRSTRLTKSILDGKNLETRFQKQARPPTSWLGVHACVANLECCQNPHQDAATARKHCATLHRLRLDVATGSFAAGPRLLPCARINSSSSATTSAQQRPVRAMSRVSICMCGRLDLVRICRSSDLPLMLLLFDQLHVRSHFLTLQIRPAIGTNVNGVPGIKLCTVPYRHARQSSQQPPQHPIHPASASPWPTPAPPHAPARTFLRASWPAALAAQTGSGPRPPTKRKCG